MATSQSKAAKSEAKLESLSVPFHDVTYVIPREHVDNLELYEALEDGNYIIATRGFLGPEQWDAFKDAHRVNGLVPMSAMNELLDAIMAAVGNLSASPAS